MPIDSTAVVGISMSAPFSFIPSYSMFIARSWRAVGLSRYDCAATWNEFAISISACPRMMRACFSRAACASRDIASCSATGMTTSRISTEDTVTPHGLERWSISCCRSASIRSRPRSRSVSVVRPMMSRSAVCAAQLTACA